MVTRAIAWLCGIALAGCAVENSPMAPLALDRDYFRCHVQPVLAARCALPACHASARRPLSIFAPGRMRWQVGWDTPTAPITDYELDSNFGIASGFATSSAAGEPWLLAKPLAPSAGGYYHRAADLFGSEDVFLTKTDVGYQTIASWIAGDTATSDCTPITEVGP